MYAIGFIHISKTVGKLEKCYNEIEIKLREIDTKLCSNADKFVEIEAKLNEL